MPLKLNVGIQKKHGLPNYSSVSSGCSIELELDQSLLLDDPAEFQDRVRRTYAACREAVETELARQLNGEPTDPAADGPTAAEATGGSRCSAGRRSADDRPASRKQLAYIEKLAKSRTSTSSNLQTSATVSSASRRPNCQVSGLRP
jgi:hypothetical protein